MRDRAARIMAILIGVAALAVAAIAVGLDYFHTLPPDTQSHYVGRTSCIECHQEEAALFHGSDHDLAMGHATEESVLGDFGDVTFEHHGIVSRMFRSGDKFMIHTEGPDGQMGDFEIKYVFGVRPLQQYMVEFDRHSTTPSDAVARLQVLRISWDTSKGRWFYLEPPDVPERLDPTDDLHWTGITQRWNTMCAECHSTNLKKNFDPETQRYATTYSEIDVSCEACHGPGSTHVQLATAKSLFWDRRLGYGLVNLKTESNEPQIEACAPCHSRRGMLAEGFEAGDAYCDYFDPSPLRETLYHDDGQILDEVYVYGSFMQSKMYHKGIRCTDCHDPHSLKLKATGNQVCTSCHQHPSGKYDTPSHHKHVPGQPGSACVDCHMPARTYMAVDPRRDHSLRIPRPDLSVAAGTPNACTGCHLRLDAVAETKRSDLVEYADWQRLAAEGDAEVQTEIQRADAWCDAACKQWYGSERNVDPHYGSAFAAVRRGTDPDGDRLLELARANATVPAIVRATALDDLISGRVAAAPEKMVSAASESKDDPSPMVRAAAIRAMAAAAPMRDGRNRLVTELGPSLDDPSRLVRSTAARVLASTGAYTSLSGGRVTRFRQVIDEIQAGLKANSDRGGAHMDWAILCESLGRFNEAVAAYRTAILVQPTLVGPRSNLAGLLDNMIQAQSAAPQADQKQIKQMRDAVANLRQQELPLLERDARLVPENGPLQYRLGMAYYLAGQPDRALKQLTLAAQLEPENEDFQVALRLLREKMAESP
jgi:tetratricopeptide (TPR) repeat protein